MGKKTGNEMESALIYNDVPLRDGVGAVRITGATCNTSYRYHCVIT